jgi:hypothetical protein
MRLGEYFFLLLIAMNMAMLFVSGATEKKGNMENYLKRTGRAFLDEVSSREGILKLKSGMLIEVSLKYLII